MPTSSFEDIFNSPDLTEAEKQRLKKIAAGIDRNSRLGIVAAMSSDEGLQRIASPLIQSGRDDRIQYAAKFDAEKEAAAKLADTLQRSLDREEARLFREQQQKDLQEYRRQSLGQNAQRIALSERAAQRAGGLTAYQQAKMEEAERARQAAAAAKLNAGVTKYGADLAGISELQTAVGQVDSLIAPHRKSGNIPGVGGWANLPGFLGTAAAKLEGGSDIRNALAPVNNLILKARSGGAVTPQEADRLQTEFGKVMGADDKDFLTAWDAFKARNGRLLAAIESQYTPDVLSEYERRRKAREAAMAQPGANDTDQNLGAY